MDSSASSTSRASAVYENLTSGLKRVPLAAWMVFTLFVLGAIALAIRGELPATDVNLRLKVQHSFRTAQLSVWVDGKLAYSGKLFGSVKKKFGFIPGSVEGSLSETLALTPGPHTVRVRVSSDDGSVQEDSVQATFTANNPRTLSVTARRDDLSLAWQGVSAVSPPADPGSSTAAGWLQRYGGSLLMTVAGSIVSALTGYAIRELPKQFGSRQEEQNKA